MADWASGYVSDIDYTFGYYPELNPLSMKLPFLLNGLVPPKVETACELGFGQGVSVNIHAAATKIAWWGTDFNPSQAGFARELAQISGSRAALYDESFAEFASRTDLPDFDFIGLHGIWSWISAENRRVIVDFLRRKLAVGGVLYVSYNTLPGWSSFVPMRHLMAEHSDIVGSTGDGMVARIDGAMAFAERFLATNPAFNRAMPGVEKKLTEMKGKPRPYLAHEYFNRDWHPMHFTEMSECLSEAKLNYACSAEYLDQLEAVNFTADQKEFLLDISNVTLRETVRDFMVNKSFRRDYWVKGPRRLSNHERKRALLAIRVVMIRHRPDVSLEITGPAGKANLDPAIYDPILNAMADLVPRTLEEIADLVAASEASVEHLFQAIHVLTCKGVMVLTKDHADGDVPGTKALNAHICKRAAGSNDVAYLASPVTGGGVLVYRIEQLFVNAIIDDPGHSPEDWAHVAWEQLKSVNEKLVKDGKPLESDEENIAELTLKAQKFAGKALPILRALGVA
ncbi:methyltransferase regulatory domain-containing protein [Luminiphilus sp.]|nr:methyltransferase regulatory domain-containing protein [Luminiphilus sp.]MDA8677587.1 methyltransferase regulatory domain-containing protein [Luminiphilus sp.]